MTIAKRLLLLVAVPLLVLLGIGLLSRFQLIKVESRVRYAAEIQVQSLAALGNISRTLTEMRVNLRSFLLARNETEQNKARIAFDTSHAELTRLLRYYADSLISDSQDQRQLLEYRTLSDRWIADAEKIMSMAAEGRTAEALTQMQGAFTELGDSLSKVSSEWIQHNEQLAKDSGKAALASIAESHRNMIFAVVVALSLAGWLGAAGSLVAFAPGSEHAVQTNAGVGGFISRHAGDLQYGGG